MIEYGPREWAASLIGQAKGDLLQQRVITSFERRADAPTMVGVEIDSYLCTQARVSPMLQLDASRLQLDASRLQLDASRL